ncbi:putative secreted protein [Corynebacterium ulcerans 809]|uniref:hypothetical protein n=1 Tax=Corynebacterium ulcerans TaxID=65058 RepID=UPI00021851DE|nr:hypothetical protein [Corynebacterium ulcerans]AEG82487.1 putative secreted protein [Corynebacterium ulcerans 809]
MNIDSIYSNISRRIAAPRIHRLVISAIIGVLSGLIIPEEATAQPTIEHPSQSDSISSLKDSYHLPKLTRPPVAAEQQLHKKDLQAATWTKIMVAPGKSKTIPIKEVFFDSPICTIIRDSDDIEPVWVTHEPSTTRFSEIFRVHVPTTAHLGDTHLVLVYKCDAETPDNAFTFEITVADFDQDTADLAHNKASSVSNRAEAPTYYDNSNLLWLFFAVVPLIAILCAIAFWSLTTSF